MMVKKPNENGNIYGLNGYCCTVFNFEIIVGARNVHRTLISALTFRRGQLFKKCKTFFELIVAIWNFPVFIIIM